MNSILIVLPILTVLMFDLGLTLEMDDFKRLAQRPRPILVGMVGQLIVLPVLAFILAETFHLSPIFYIGMVLIACCPGGSSSNVFSMLAKGDVALSVSLTALSSLITLLTVPVILEVCTQHVGAAIGVTLPVGNLLMQNVVTMLLPILLGIGIRKWKPLAASKMDKILSKIAFPALMFLAGVFFVQHHDTIADNFMELGICILLMLLLSTSVASVMSYFAMRKSSQDEAVRTRRTIIIEVGMQNAAQAIAVASSPFIFNDGRIAIPAIIYALLMNVVLLCYVGWIKWR